MSKIPQKQQAPFSLRIPPKLREEFEDYAKSQEITLTQAILDSMRERLNR